MSYIDDTQKLDLLWKKFQFGVSQTDPAKSPYEEYTASSTQVRTSDIWKQDGLIASTPAAVTGVVEQTSIQLIRDPSVIDGSTWISVSSVVLGLIDSNRLGDFIHTRYSPFYEIKVYKDVTRSERIFNSRSETNWIFDYNTGILWFPQIEVLDITEVYIDGWRYIGDKGLPTLQAGDLVDTLQVPTSGSYTGGYVPGWIAEETKIADAVDQLNKSILGLIPQPPKNLDEFYIKIPAAKRVIDEANIVLSHDYANAAGAISGKPVPGSVVDRVVGMNLVSDTIGPFGIGNSGVLTLNLNGASAGFVALDYGDQTGIYGALEVSADETTEGAMVPFFQSLKARAKNLNVPTGLNVVQLSHTTTGATYPYWIVRDSAMTVPSVTALGVTVADNAPISFSSGVPHYARGTTLKLAATAANLATDLHLDSRQFVFNTLPVEAGLEVWSSVGLNGLPDVLSKGVNHSISDLSYRIDDVLNEKLHGSVKFRVSVQNANGRNFMDSSRGINFMRDGDHGDGLGPVEETATIITPDLGVFEEGMQPFAVRVALASGANPAVEFNEGQLPTWDSAQTVAPYEAVVVGGRLRGENLDYTPYFPSGPNYSSKDGIQYATFAVQRKHVSQMRIEIEGAYSGLWVKLPGIADQGLAVNGWMDCFTNYEGFGVPGREVASGCALGVAALGGSQSVVATFGYESSSNSTNNLILVRFRMVAGQQISGLRFSGVSYE